MSYKIIGDSCLDLTPELKKDKRFQTIPLSFQVDDAVVVDDETFDQQAFLKMIAASPNCPKSACPSPEAFKEAYTCEEEDVFVITLSSKLSGSYNSAALAKNLYEEEYGKKNILVIDSESASGGELNLALRICELYEQGELFESVSEKVLALRDKQKTYFVLDTLEILRKNGRLTGLQAFFATTLNIKPVMGTQKGEIIKLEQARGTAKALGNMCGIVVKEAVDMSKCRAIISHCNCPERALKVKQELESRGTFGEIMITETAGVSTMYAADGGIILVVG